MRQSTGALTGKDQRTRDAAIAAMGQRLAAAGPRTRHRMTKSRHPAAEPTATPIENAPPARAPGLVADRSQAFIRDVAPIVPPSPRRKAMTAIGRVAALASMASAGFAVVLLAQSPRWSAALHHAVAPKAQDAVQSDELQPTPLPNIAPARVAENATATPAPIQAPPPVTLPAAKPAASQPIAAPPAAAPQPSAVQPRQPRPVQVQLASRPRPVAPKPVQLAAHHDTPPRPTMLAHYVLPRWLTEARDPPRPLIMSPPPHDLVAPESLATRATAPPVQLASAALAERPSPALPPLPRPRIIYAYAGYAAPAPYRPAAPYGYDGPAYPPIPYAP